MHRKMHLSPWVVGLLPACQKPHSSAPSTNTNPSTTSLQVKRKEECPGLESTLLVQPQDQLFQGTPPFTPRSACPTDIHVVTKDTEFELEQTFWFYEQMKLSSQILTWIYPRNVLLSMFLMFWCSYVLPELCGF